MKRFATIFFALVLGCVMLMPSASGAPRKILAELFTSTTCAPCYPADVYYFRTWLPNYPARDQVITIAYHVWWPPPGDDPLYLANPAPVQVRMPYYQPSQASAPWMMVDGSITAGENYILWPGAIEPRLLVSSPIAIVLSGSRNGLVLTMNARVTAEQAVNSANWRIHWVVLEDSVPAPQWNGSRYVPFAHDWAHRAMLPDANGAPISISQGQTVNVPRTVTLNSSWRAAKTKIVVFVQDNATKAVQNAEVIDVASIATGVNEGADVPAAFALGQNYPNPFNPTTTIAFDVARESFVDLSVYNVLGQKVRTLVADVRAAGSQDVVWDGRDEAGREVPSGIYLYRMNAGQFQDTRRMVLVR